MFISLLEILYIVILTVAVGFIFSGFFKKPTSPEEVMKGRKFFDWKQLGYAALVAAPGIILHELAHKFVAMGFGLNATFHLFWGGLGIGVLLKVLGSGFMFLAPGYVSVIGATPFQSAVTSFAGPLTNLLIWVGCFALLKVKKDFSRKWALIIGMGGKLNLFLFLFNSI